MSQNPASQCLVTAFPGCNDFPYVNRCTLITSGMPAQRSRYSSILVQFFLKDTSPFFQILISIFLLLFSHFYHPFIDFILGKNRHYQAISYYLVSAAYRLQIMIEGIRYGGVLCVGQRTNAGLAQNKKPHSTDL